MLLLIVVAHLKLCLGSAEAEKNVSIWRLVWLVMLVSHLCVF